MNFAFFPFEKVKCNQALTELHGNYFIANFVHAKHMENFEP